MTEIDSYIHVGELGVLKPIDLHVVETDKDVKPSHSKGIGGVIGREGEGSSPSKFLQSGKCECEHICTFRE